jgi:hypothetical protein
MGQLRSSGGEWINGGTTSFFIVYDEKSRAPTGFIGLPNPV